MVLPLAALSVLLAACSAEETQMMDLVNASRSQYGLAAYQPNSSLYMKASAWAQYMGTQAHTLVHSNLAADNPYQWRKLAENVGVGGDMPQIHNAFMNSSGHRANILDRSMQYFGIGVYSDGSRYWVTEEFMQL